MWKILSTFADVIKTIIMSNELTQMTEEQFDEKYSPQINHIERALAHKDTADEDVCSFGGRMYETFGEDLEFVKQMAKENRVVTIIEGEDEVGEDGEEHSVMYYSSGMHIINRIGFLVTSKPLEEEFEIKLDW